MTARLPEAFEREFRAAFGGELFSLVSAAITETPPEVSVRVNGQKAALLPSAGERVTWHPERGLYIGGEKPLFGADPLWHGGAYYVQEAGSMILSKFLEGEKPGLILDLCAAPGGKSTLLRDFFAPDASLSEPLLIANEPIRDRAVILRENLLRWGADEVIVTSAYPDALAASGLRADLILVDAPCSGEGMFRKDPDSIAEWSEAAVSLCVSRQREILSAALEMLTDGGLLIYSTCTYNPRENEEQLSWLLDQEDRYDLSLVTLPEEWDRLCLLRPGVYRFMPGVTRSEGLTAFAVRKRSDDVRTPFGRLPKAPRIRVPEELKALPQDFCEFDGRLSLLSDRGKEIVERLQRTKGVRILSAGLPLGETKGKYFLPAQGWMSSGTFAPALPYPRLEASADEALALLRRETPLLEAPGKGLHLITYRGLPLMLIKHLGNRVNSLYPKEWAIKKLTRLTPADLPELPLLIKKNAYE